MKRKPYLLAVAGLFICCLATGQDVVVETKLSTARSDYQKAVEKLRVGLSAELRKKAEAAQKAGDLKGLEAVEAEVKAFEDKGVLPKSVPTKSYDAGLRLAKAKLEDAYSAAVKEYTKAGQRAQAKAVQQEMDDFKSGKSSILATSPTDLVTIGSSWSGQRKLSAAGSNANPFSMRISERIGDKIKGEIFVNAKRTYSFEGTVKGDAIEFTTELKEGFQQTYKGIMSKETIQFKFTGTADGDATLSLEKRKR